jgi:hypothetical protein
MWVGKENTSRAGQIGVRAVNSDSTFWSDVIGDRPQDERHQPPQSFSKNVPAMAKVTKYTR